MKGMNADNCDRWSSNRPKAPVLIELLGFPSPIMEANLDLCFGFGDIHLGSWETVRTTVVWSCARTDSRSPPKPVSIFAQHFHCNAFFTEPRLMYTQSRLPKANVCRTDKAIATMQKLTAMALKKFTIYLELQQQQCKDSKHVNPKFASNPWILPEPST